MRLPVWLAAGLLGASLTAPVSAQTASEPAPASNVHVTPAEIDRRLELRAADVQKMAPTAARIITFDLAWPGTPDEYRALGKRAVVFVGALSQQADELPLRRVYTKVGGKVIPLQKISSRRSDVAADTLAHKVFGPFREDGWYLVPAGALMSEWLLFADFAKNRNEFVINRNALEPPDFIRQDRDRSKAGTAKPDAIKALLAREYPGFDHGH